MNNPAVNYSIDNEMLSGTGRDQSEAYFPSIKQYNEHVPQESLISQDAYSLHHRNHADNKTVAGSKEESETESEGKTISPRAKRGKINKKIPTVKKFGKAVHDTSD